MKDEFDPGKAASIIEHPLRRKIILVLGSSGPLSWKELSRATGSSTGALYHHLDILERIVIKDSSKRYSLSELGMEVYEFVSQGGPTFGPEGIAKILGKRRPWEYFMNGFAPRGLVTFLSLSRVRTVLAVLGCLVVLFSSALFSRLQVVIMALTPSPSLPWALFWLGVSVGVLHAAIYVASLATKSRLDHVVLLVSVLLSLLPLAALSLLLRAAFIEGPLAWPGGPSGATLTLVAFQTWGMGILAAGSSASTGIRLEKTLTWSLLILYASTVAMLVYGVRLV